jgi:hypothetical protein
MSSPTSPLFDLNADSLSTNSANRNVFAGNGEGNAGYTIDRASQIIHSEVIIPFSFGTISLQNSNGFASASRPNPMAYFDGFCASTGSLVKVNDGDSGVVANSYLATKNGSPVFRVQNTDGAIFSNAGTIGSPADYAEMFEWEDGNPSAEDRVGMSVAIGADGKVKIAQAGDTVIGVVSGNPLVLGDAHWAHWKDKFIKDEFNRHIKEDVEYVEWLTTDAEGKPVGNVYAIDSLGDVVPPFDAKHYAGKRDKLNATYDPDAEYVPRSDRVEWDAVGLMGKLPLRKGQITATTWIKLKDISADVELWFVK